MEGINRAVSFILGLAVVIVLIALISGRLNLKNKLSQLTKAGAGNTPTPTAIKTTKPTIYPAQISPQPTIISYKPSVGGPQVKTPTTIPSTGLPTIFLPLAFSLLVGGLHLRRAKTRNF